MDLPVIDYETPGARDRRLYDREWMRRGICSTAHEDVQELFYSPTHLGGGKNDREPILEQRNREAAAVRACRPCPVRERCLIYALDFESVRGVAGRNGVWGGTTPADRDAIWAEMGYTSRAVTAA